MRMAEARRRAAPSRHLVDVTMFWGSTSGGVRRYIEAKGEWLRGNTRWQHTALVPAPRGVSVDAALGLPSLPLPFAPGYRVARSRRASSARLCELRPDLIEAGDPYNLAWAALDAARMLRVPAVAFAHSDLAALAARVAGAAAERLAQRYLRHLYSQFDLVLAPGRRLAERLRALELRAQVAEQPLGVDTRTFHPLRADRRWREALNLPAGTRLLAYAGRFAPEKNLPLLVQALRRLGPGYALVAIGAGPAPPRADRGERLIVLPFERDRAALARVLASCDVFVHAGDIETFGLVALEAMACGTPVVASGASGLGELVDETVGCRVDGANATRFAEAIAAVCGRDRRRLALAARQRGFEYDWTRVLPTLLRRYVQLVDEGACAAPRPHAAEARAALTAHG